MDILKSYKRNIVENKNIVLVSIFLSILIRILLFYVDTNIQSHLSQSFFLSQKIPLGFLSNRFMSFFLSSLFALGIMSYAAYLNSKYSLIRTRSYLVCAFVILIFSCNPVFIYMNSGYITLLLFIICVDILFSSYQEMNPARKSYAIGFISAISSLFSFNNLFYLVLFWAGFKIMRSFTFKSFLTSILGVFTIYWLVFCFYLWKSNLDEFIFIFEQVKSNLEYILPSLDTLLAYSISVVFLLIAVLDNQIDSYQDKIRVREKISFLNLISIFSLFFFLFVGLNNSTSFYVFEFCYAILLAHFFALVIHNWQVYLFYIFVLLTIIRGLFF